jgi:hypothetical protein
VIHGVVSPWHSSLAFLAFCLGIGHFPARTRTGIAAAASEAKATLTTRVEPPAWRSVRHIAARRIVIRVWFFMAGSFPCDCRCFPHIYSDTAARRWLAKNPAMPKNKTRPRRNIPVIAASKLARLSPALVPGFGIEH